MMTSRLHVQKALAEDLLEKGVQITRTTCGYCGVGCQLDVYTFNGQIIRVDAPDLPPNYGRLCVKGRFGLDFATHKERLTKPLIKDRSTGKFREASWEEALDEAAKRLVEIYKHHGSDALGLMASAKITNEENFIAMKLMRALFQTNNVDHCARLCHASSVVGLQMSIGAAAMSNSIQEIQDNEVLLVTGSNTTETHPVIALEIKKAVRKKRAKLIVVDPRAIELTQFATLWLQQTVGTDIAVFTAMAQVIIEEKLYDQAFIEERVEGFEEYKEFVKDKTPEWAEKLSGVPAEKIREAARMYAKAKNAGIYWAMGITQHTHGVGNVLALANLALLTGNLGKWGTGLNPLRGQNNVQGASDFGGLPNVFSGYQKVSDENASKKFAKAWHSELSLEPGLTVGDMIEAAAEGFMKGIYVIGENPLMSEPDLEHARRSLQKLDFLLVQDIFMTETAELADIVLPAANFLEKDGTFTNTDRRVQRVRKILDPPGEAKPDWVIISELAKRIEHYLGKEESAGWDYKHPSEIFDEAARLTPSLTGINYKRLEERGIQWPCPSFGHPGTVFLHKGTFPRGKGKLHPTPYERSIEQPDETYPFLLTTGRIIFHWHTGSMTRRSKLDEIAPYAKLEINPKDARDLQIKDGDLVEITSRRGSVKATAWVTERVPPGTVFLPFHYKEAAANILTINAVDPRAKIPEYKVSAVKLRKISETGDEAR